MAAACDCVSYKNLFNFKEDKIMQIKDLKAILFYVSLYVYAMNVWRMKKPPQPPVYAL